MNIRTAKRITKNPEETAQAAKELARFILKKGKQKKAVIVGLSGELGAGKTTFVKAFAKEFGVKETVVSPTFILERIYDLPKIALPFRRLVHIDAYRISGKGKEELGHLGWDRFVSSPDVVMIVEWADKVEKFLPKDAIKFIFAHKGRDTREIHWN